MKSKFQVFIPILFSVAVIIGMMFGYNLRDNMPNRNFWSKEKRSTVTELIYLLENNYVDSVQTNNLADTAIAAILSKLDPHSIFIPKDELDDINNEMQGGFFGIGVEYSIIDDTLHVTNLMPGGPSEKAGVMSGDRILKVNDSVIVGNKITSLRARRLFRGAYESKLRLSIFRNGAIKPIEVSRGMIPIKSVEAFYMVDATTGYIKIESFTTKTYKEFMTALTNLKEKGLKKLILDLRGNGGGILEEAVEIADEFLSGDKMVSYTEGLHYPKKEYRCRRDGQFEQGELVVIADGGSASASEILLGALQDWDRATIVGSQSFGKGLVQNQYNLSDGSGLRLTTARYFTPLGRSIQRSYAQGKLAYYNSKHVLDSAVLAQQKSFTTPNGKKLTDKNGITPDVSLSNADSSNLLPEIAYVIGQNYLGQYAYFQSEGLGLRKKFASVQKFANDYQVNESELKQFEQFVAKRDSAAGLKQRSRPEIAKWLRVAFARHLFGVKGYVEVFNQQDSTFQEALRIIKEKP